MAAKALHSFSCILLIFLHLRLLSDAHVYLPDGGDSSLFAFLNHSSSEIRKGNKIKGLYELKSYLMYLGYYSSENQAQAENDLFDDRIESAIKSYQLFHHLNVTGMLDADTLATITQPRCGVPDFFNPKEEQNDSKREFEPKPNKSDDIRIMFSHYRFFPGVPRWPSSKRSLTYSFQPGTRKDAVDSVRRALQKWSSVSPFKFTYHKNYSRADIKVSFQRGDHGDGNPFEELGKRGVTLAHAFAPTDGRLHYNAAQKWSTNLAPKTYDLESIGLHELGHILGLEHSSDKNAIMYPVIAPGTKKGLGGDDIKGIKTLYRR